MIHKNIRRMTAAISLGLACAAVSTVSHATHSWGGYHWARTTPQFTVKVGNNLTTADWRAHLAQTSLDWNAGNSAVLTSIVAGTSNKSCSMVTGTIQVCNRRYGNTGWLGLASINLTGGTHITQGSAKLNDTYFDTATYNNPNERLHVMCQEVAHAFGLDHQSVDGSSQNSCMDYFSNTGANATSTLSTKPNAHDFAQLNLIYGHLDSSTTVAAIAAAAASRFEACDAPPCVGTGGTASSAGGGQRASDIDISDDPNSWGKLVSQAAHGRSSTYERQNRDGSKTVTHVFWTLEAARRSPGSDHRYD